MSETTSKTADGKGSRIGEALDRVKRQAGRQAPRGVSNRGPEASAAVFLYLLRAAAFAVQGQDVVARWRAKRCLEKGRDHPIPPRPGTP